jgi:hypothetical protein
MPGPGLSYEYVTGRLAEVAPFHARGLIVCISAPAPRSCAIRKGHSVASSADARLRRDATQAMSTQLVLNGSADKVPLQSGGRLRTAR